MRKRTGIKKGKVGPPTHKDKRPKRCSKEGCDNILRSHNKKGLCRHHYRSKWAINKRAILIKKHLCISCSSKVELKYNIRCERCNEKQRSYSKKYWENQKTKIVTT